MKSENDLSTQIDSGLTARQFNIIRSPKNNGSAECDSTSYLRELGITIKDSIQAIKFQPNTDEPVHRWSPYVQGFSAKFVQLIIDKHKYSYNNLKILDPFAGCGTVLVQSKFNNIEVDGIELNPLLHFITNTKVTTWQIKPGALLANVNNIKMNHVTKAPEFLKSDRHFELDILKSLERLKGGIDHFEAKTVNDKNIKKLMLLAFSSILIDCSNLKRSPCLGYCKKKNLDSSTPIKLFKGKIEQIAEDLDQIQKFYKNTIYSKAHTELSNAMTYKYNDKYNIVITSPPYMNGLDYVINYKIEMGWLGYGLDHKQLKKIKDDMVVCDNVSKGMIRKFSENNNSYSNDWIENIKEKIIHNIDRRGAYRRIDMPYIVHKYFDDMYRVMKNLIPNLDKNARFILVIGDSLIADVYVPTDLILARIGMELGMEIESIEKARERRSGQIRSYKLRETIVTLKKKYE